MPERMAAHLLCSIVWTGRHLELQEPLLGLGQLYSKSCSEVEATMSVCVGMGIGGGEWCHSDHGAVGTQQLLSLHRRVTQAVGEVWEARCPLSGLSSVFFLETPPFVLGAHFLFSHDSRPTAAWLSQVEAPGCPQCRNCCAIGHPFLGHSGEKARLVPSIVACAPTVEENSPRDSAPDSSGPNLDFRLRNTWFPTGVSWRAKCKNGTGISEGMGWGQTGEGVEPEFGTWARS